MWSHSRLEQDNGIGGPPTPLKVGGSFLFERLILWMVAKPLVFHDSPDLFPYHKPVLFDTFWLMDPRMDPTLLDSKGRILSIDSRSLELTTRGPQVLILGSIDLTRATYVGYLILTQNHMFATPDTSCSPGLSTLQSADARISEIMKELKQRQSDKQARVK